MIACRRRTALRIGAAALVAAALLSVPAAYIYQENAFWQQVRSRMRLHAVELAGWHPTRPELLGVAGYQDATSLAPLEQRLVTIDMGGNLHFLKTVHSASPYAWSPDGECILFARQRHGLSRGDLRLWTIRPGATETVDWEARDGTWRRRAHEQELSILDAGGRLQRLDPGPPASCLLHAAWLGDDQVAATVNAIEPPFRGVLRIWSLPANRPAVSEELPPGFVPAVLCSGPGGRLAMEGGVSGGIPTRRLRSAICVRSRDGQWREVELAADTVQGALQWLRPPANALVTRRHLKMTSGSAMSYLWVDSETLRPTTVMVPGLAGWVYKGGRWSPSGDAVALTAFTRGAERAGGEALIVWRRDWQRPRVAHRGPRLTSVLWSPDGRRLAMVEDGTKVRFVEAPQS